MRSCGLSGFPCCWTGAIRRGSVLSWLRHLALDGKLAKAEPKTLRYRLFHTAARLVRGGRRKTLKIAAAWPRAEAIIAAWKRIQALPHPT